jgi:type I restriction enzyme M protein
MRHFATQSGKSKRQFHTLAEVSRVIARVIGISPQNTKLRVSESATPLSP